MSYPVASCSLCGKPIEDTSKHMIAKQVVGWALPRSKGGVNALVGRRDTGAIAHVHCAKQFKAGTLNQESLSLEPLWSE